MQKGILIFAHSLILLVFFAVAANAQSRPITADEYDRVFNFAVSETNAAFPFIFTVVTDSFRDGKLVKTETEVKEREAAGRERTTKATVADGKTMKQLQVSLGFGVVYCSEDGVNWKPPSQYECDSGPFTVYGKRNTKSIEYSVEEKSLNGKPVKVYREYSVFPPLKPNGKKDFRDNISTIDSRGFFISVVTTEGTLDPKTVKLTRTQSWDAKTKFKPIVAPIN